jgi:hypothetical protein
VQKRRDLLPIDPRKTAEGHRYVQRLSVGGARRMSYCYRSWIQECFRLYDKVAADYREAVELGSFELAELYGKLIKKLDVALQARRFE